MEKKMNNKGFSLVELIVVIAIMAVLIGVLAPQFIKYVEKSRVSTDIQNVDQVVVALQTWGAEHPFPDTAESWTITTSDTEVTSKPFIEAALSDAGLSKKISLKSSNWSCGATQGVVIEVSKANGVTAKGKNVDKILANGAE